MTSTSSVVQPRNLVEGGEVEGEADRDDALALRRK